MEHPHTVGTFLPGAVLEMFADGCIADRTLIHTFSRPSTSSALGISVLTQSPAVDVLGVGYQDGTIRIMDIRQGEDIFIFKMEEGGIAGLSFRMGENIVHVPIPPAVADLYLFLIKRDRQSWRAPQRTVQSPSGICTSAARSCTPFATHTRKRLLACNGLPASRF